MSVLLLAEGRCASQKTDFYTQSIEESLIPVRPGVPGSQPFWNKHARCFIYAPAFEFEKLQDAKYYRVTAQPASAGPDYANKHQFDPFGDNTGFVAQGKALVFEADSPWAPLTPIWKQLPVGVVNLRVEALKEKGGEVIGLAGSRWFYKAAVFHGPYNKPAMDYEKSARLALKKLFEEKFVQSWLRTGQPDRQGYELYHYPAKIMGALMVGAAAYYNLSPRPDDAESVLEIGKKVADYLLSISFPAPGPLEYFPPTYYGIKDKSHMDDRRSMMLYAADAGHGYLDLYDVTKDEKYLAAATRIADTYVKNQLPDGSWFLLVENSTGKPVAENLCIPTAIINYFDRLVEQYGLARYKEASQKAVKWIMDNPVKTFNWQAQFEDSTPAAPYKNLAREQACDFAIYLLAHASQNPENIKLAEELIRFAEDQFVVWERPVASTAGDENSQSDFWITPCVQEQYTYWQPVIRSAGIMIRTYQKAYQITGADIYLAKATSIANSITITQQAHDGKYPTYLTSKPMDFWINNVVWPATDMIRLGRMLER